MEVAVSAVVVGLAVLVGVGIELVGNAVVVGLGVLVGVGIELVSNAVVVGLAVFVGVGTEGVGSAMVVCGAIELLRGARLVEVGGVEELGRLVVGGMSPVVMGKEVVVGATTRAHTIHQAWKNSYTAHVWAWDYRAYLQPPTTLSEVLGNKQ